METSTNEYYKGAVETLLFISEKPVTIEQLKEALQTVETSEIKRYLQELSSESETQKRGMVIVEIAGGYQMLSSPQYVNFVRNFFKTRVKEKLSRPSLETLAIVAYKQPVSRMDVEMIRGVNSDGVVAHLLNKNLIKIVGRKDVPGKPYLYGTTKVFMEYFGLKSLRDLPKLEDFPALLPPEQELADAPPEVQQAGAEDTMKHEPGSEPTVGMAAAPSAEAITPVGQPDLKQAMESLQPGEQITDDDQVQSYARATQMSDEQEEDPSPNPVEENGK